MTIVETSSNEVADLDITEAKAITNRIRQHLAVASVEWKKAYRGRAWIALGYDSWEDYCTSEFVEHVRLSRDDRREVVVELADAGMSTRAIAAATGVSDGTVRNDIAAGAQNYAPDPDDEIVDAEVVEEPTPREVTGRDGKTYTLTPKPTRQKEEDVNTVSSVKALAALGLNATQIAEDIGLSQSRVSAIAGREGIVIRGNRLDKDARAKKAADLAASGHTTRQIAEQLNMGREGARAFLKRYDIEVPADAVVGTTRHVDPIRFIDQTVLDLEAAVMSLTLLPEDLSTIEVDPAVHADWVTSLNESLPKLRSFVKHIKEMTQ